MTNFCFEFMNNFLASTTPADMPAPFGFDTWLTFWMSIAIATLNALAMCFAGYKFLQVIQLSGYKISGYFAWIRDTKAKYWGHLGMLAFLSSCALLITNVLLSDFFVFKIMTYLGLIFYAIFLLVFISNLYTASQKTPLKYTHRLNRLVVVLFFVVFVSTFFIVNLSTLHVPYFRFGAVALTPLFLPLFILIAFYIVLPFEKLNNRRYLLKAAAILDQRTDLIKIGITGSFGKTSVKNILSTILSEKFSVCATPHSYNTPLGLSKTVLNNLKPEHQILVAEMGARNVGDIAYLCSFVKPSIGLLTGTGNQHLSTFGSIENIKKTKFELVLGLALNGKMFFNGDNEGALELFELAKTKKEFTSVLDEKSNVFAKNVSVSANGSEFDLCTKSGSVHCVTKLLGKHNISNILLCSAVALELGLSLDEIAAGVSKLAPTAHRLSVVQSGNSLIVIDDAYNSSVEGYKAALEVLALFPGKKIVITPGLVELGKEDFNVNFQFGIDMASVCDKVIVNGVTNFDAISNGLIFGGFDEKNILRSGTLSQAVDLLNTFALPGDVVLFENDLPDNYT